LEVSGDETAEAGRKDSTQRQSGALQRPGHFLQDNGFNREEGDGSHKVYRHRLFDDIVTVSPHGAFVKPYQVRQALAALEAVRKRMEG